MTVSITLPLAKLRSAVEQVQGAAGLEAHNAEHIFMCYSDAGLSLTSSDGTMLIQATIPSDVIEVTGEPAAEYLGMWMCAVRASTLRALLKALSAEKVRLQPKGEQQVLLTTATDVFVLASLTSHPLPEILMADAADGQGADASPEASADSSAGAPAQEAATHQGVTLRLPSQHLRLALQCVMPSMPTRDLRPFLNGVLFEVDGNALTLVATNAQRMAIARVPIADAGKNGPAKAQAILPARSVSELARVLVSASVLDEVDLFVESNGMRVEFGAIKVTSKVVAGGFPDYRRAIPAVSTTTIELDHGEIEGALSAAQALATEAALPAVKIQGVKDLVCGVVHLFVQAPGMATRSHLQVAATQFEGPQTPEIVLNAHYLHSAVRTAPTKQVSMGVGTNAEGAVLIKASHKALDLTHVIMPLRL